jgi:hypothetical protein
MVASGRMRKAGLALSAVAIGAGAGCSADGRIAGEPLARGEAPALEAPESAAARAVVEEIRALLSAADRPGALGPARAAGFEREGAWLLPELPAARPEQGARRAEVMLPVRADGAFRLVDLTAGLDVEISLLGATHAAFEVAGGLVVYRRGLASGADVVHRPTEEGTEDWLFFERAPGAPEVRYEVALGEQVAGLRLVERTLELLDAGGTPRLRMAPPWGIDGRGARFWARVAVEGCAYDADPRPPWGRAVVAPGARRCTVLVGWDAGEVSMPALLDPAWSVTGKLVQARASHAALTLKDGRVLVSGGHDGLAPTASAELYDPTTGTWSSIESMSVPRNAPTMTEISQGKVLVTGGVGSSNEPLLSAEVYEPDKGRWRLTQDMGSPRMHHTATALSDGRVLVVGGGRAGIAALGSAEVFDVGKASWTPVESMSGLRYNHAAILLPGGKVLVAGGSDGFTAAASAEVFDPGAGSWKAAGVMTSARVRPTASLLADGSILVAGGAGTLGASDGLTSAEVFDPIKGAWRATGGAMSAGRMVHTANVLTNREVLVVGGLDGGLGTAEAYDPVTESFRIFGSLNVPRVFHTSNELLDGRILVAGGVSKKDGSPVADAEVMVLLTGVQLGSPCAARSECSSGFCVDGVCCNEACEGACQACDGETPGTCAAVTGEPHGDRPTCGPFLCKAGACAAECASVDDCAASFVCDDTGPRRQCVALDATVINEWADCGCAVPGARGSMAAWALAALAAGALPLRRRRR